MVFIASHIGAPIFLPTRYSIPVKETFNLQRSFEFCTLFILNFQRLVLVILWCCDKNN